MARLIDEALIVASRGWLSDPLDGLRGALVALMEAGMLTAPPRRPEIAAPARPRVTLVREHPKEPHAGRQLGSVVPRLALPRGAS